MVLCSCLTDTCYPENSWNKSNVFLFFFISNSLIYGHSPPILRNSPVLYVYREAVFFFFFSVFFGHKIQYEIFFHLFKTPKQELFLNLIAFGLRRQNINQNDVHGGKTINSNVQCTICVCKTSFSISNGFLFIVVAAAAAARRMNERRERMKERDRIQFQWIDSKVLHKLIR